MRQLTLAALGALLIVLTLGGFGLRAIWMQPVLLSAGAVVSVAPGQSLRDVLAEAESAGWIRHSFWVGQIARWYDLDKRMQAGEFEILPGATGESMVRLLASGRVRQYRVTLPEGLTLDQALERLGRNPHLRKTPKAEAEAALLELVGRSDSAEGWFLPETWAFTTGDSDLDLLQRAHEAMRDLLESLWVQRDPGLPLATAYEALILASIVERETGIADERPQIAGVFLRRLKRGMRLQTDPTVIYGLGDAYQGDLKRRHLRDKANPYNTYVIPGLPPTPIALPGEAALRAVFSPDESENLYFVAKGDGSHAFSGSLEAHEALVRRYQLSPRADYRSSPTVNDGPSP